MLYLLVIPNPACLPFKIAAIGITAISDAISTLIRNRFRGDVVASLLGPCDFTSRRDYHFNSLRLRCCIVVMLLVGQDGLCDGFLAVSEYGFVYGSKR